MEERLQKILSRAGVTSRRKAEELILAGSVTVNGAVVMELGSKADLDHDHIKVNGKLIRPPRELVYIALHKPKNCVTTVSDPQHRETVMDLVPVRERVFPVGRLDYHTEGLLLLTNDGEFAHKMNAPASRVPKVYMAKVTNYLTEEQEHEFRRGVPLHGRRTAPARVRLARRGYAPWYEVEITEGRNHQVRDMFQHFGLLVEKLRRTQIAFLELGNLKATEFRYLSDAEVRRFRKLLHLDDEKGGAVADPKETHAGAKPRRRARAVDDQPDRGRRRSIQRSDAPQPRRG